MKKLQTLLVLVLTLLVSSCRDIDQSQQVSDSGVKKASVKIATDPTTGMTIEQQNISERLKRDNAPGSVKHLYVISSFSGDCIMYSTVRGKVTSGGKRLSPNTVVGAPVQYQSGTNNRVTINGESYTTNELIDDGGAYGDSMPYLYWFDTKGNYQQIYPSGGMMIFISDQPLNVKSVQINLNNKG